MTDDQVTAAKLPAALAAIENSAPAPDDLAERLLDTLHQRSVPTAHPARARWLLPALSAALVAAVVVGLAVGGVFGGDRDQHTTPPASVPSSSMPTGRAASWHSYQGIRFPVPAGWKVLPVTFATAALDPPIGYITDQPTGPECAKDKAGCGAPLQNPTIGPGGILIAITAGAIVTDPSQRPWANTTVAGLPARRTDNACHSQCGPRGTQHIMIVIKTRVAAPGNTQPTGLILYVTIGPHGDQALRRLDTMLAHATDH